MNYCPECKLEDSDCKCFRGSIFTPSINVGDIPTLYELRMRNPFANRSVTGDLFNPHFEPQLWDR